MPRFVHDFPAHINLQPASNSRAFHAKRPHSRRRNHPGGFFALADRNQLAGVVVEHFAAVFGDQHEVLDAHAELAGQEMCIRDRTLHATDGESGTPEDKYSACQVKAIPDQAWAETYLVERYAELKAQLAAEADRQNPQPETEISAASSEVADVVPAVPGGAIEGGEAAGVEGSRAALAGEVSGAADVPSVAAAEPPRAFAPHEAEVAGRALYANGEEETLV